MAKREYSFALRKEAEDLYVKEEKTIEEISAATGVSVTQVQRWAKEEGWKKEKRKLHERINTANQETRALVREEILLKDLVNQKNLLDKYFKDREYDKADSNTVGNYINIINNISKLLQDIRKRDETLRGKQKADRPQVFLEFMRDLVSFLKDHDPETLRMLEKNFDEFIGFAKNKYANP